MLQSQSVCYISFARTHAQIRPRQSSIKSIVNGAPVHATPNVYQALFMQFVNVMHSRPRLI